MKLNVLLSVVLGVLLFSGCQNEVPTSGSGDTGSDSVGISADDISTVAYQIVEASCGECQFDMDGSGCDLAVRIDGESYFVDGSTMDDHGDAHGDAGMCNRVRKAKVTGEVLDGRFVATSFELLPSETEHEAEGDDHDHGDHDHGDHEH